MQSYLLGFNSPHLLPYEKPMEMKVPVDKPMEMKVPVDKKNLWRVELLKKMQMITEVVSFRCV